MAVAVLIVAGCSSSGTIKMDQAFSKGIDHRAVAALSVRPHEELGTPSDEALEAVQRLRGQLFGRLVAEGVFKQIVHEGEDATYKVDVNLVAAKEVSQGARIFFGVLAGSNSLAARVKIFDGATNAQIADFTVTGESASHPLSSENDMDDAIREVVDEIVLALQ